MMLPSIHLLRRARRMSGTSVTPPLTATELTARPRPPAAPAAPVDELSAVDTSPPRLIAMTVWITRRPDAEVADRARRRAEGALAGVRLAVKDNVDVAGLPTTAACPEFAYHTRARRSGRGGTAGGRRGRRRQDQPRPVRHRPRRHPVALRRGARQPQARIHQRRIQFGIGGRGRHRARPTSRSAPTPPGRARARRPAGHRRHQAHRRGHQHRRRGASLRIL